MGRYIKLRIDSLGKVHVIEENVYHHDFIKSRHPSTLNMFHKVYETYNPPRNITIIVNTDDTFVEGMFNYFGKDAIPCFTFEHWPTAKLPKFYDFYNNPSKTQFFEKKDKLLWIGNIDTSPVRKFFYDTFSKSLPEFEIISMAWDSNGNPYPYITLEEHAEYKYLLDIEGTGWSARLKFLLMTGSVVFIVERPSNKLEYWHNMFIPWVHYVPVKRDGSDFIENFNKVKNDSVLASSIMNNCKQKALEVFSENNVYKYFENLLLNKYKMKKKILWISLSTYNYEKLTIEHEKSLNKLIDDTNDEYLYEKRHKKFSLISNKTGFQTESWYFCIIEKLKWASSFEDGETFDYVVVSDCDIQFFSKNNWKRIYNFIDSKNESIFFMRECQEQNKMNGGFYIMKGSYYPDYIKFVKKMLIDGDLYNDHGDQTYFNNNIDLLDYCFLPDEYYIWGWMCENKNKENVLFHHAVVDTNTEDKLKQINFIENWVNDN